MGFRVQALISGNTAKGNFGAGLTVRSGPIPGYAVPVPLLRVGRVLLTASGNDFSENQAEGMRLWATATRISGTIDKNRIQGNGLNGNPPRPGFNNTAWARYYYPPAYTMPVPAASSPAFVNNLVSGNGSDGVRNEELAFPGTVGAQSALPLISWNTVVGNGVTDPNGGFGLNNIGYPFGSYPALTVRNSIFFNNTGTGGPSGSADVRTPHDQARYCDWDQGYFFNGQLPFPPPILPKGWKWTSAPLFVAGSDFRLASGQFIHDIATNNPPLVPATDIDGQSRVFDTLSIANNGPLFAEPGWDEIRP